MPGFDKSGIYGIIGLLIPAMPLAVPCTSSILARFVSTEDAWYFEITEQLLNSLILSAFFNHSQTSNISIHFQSHFNAHRRNIEVFFKYFWSSVHAAVAIAMDTLINIMICKSCQI